MERNDDIFSFTEIMVAQFVKKQNDFIRKECVKHLSENKEVSIYKIDEDKLNYIFELGLKEYQKRIGGDI